MRYDAIERWEWEGGAIVAPDEGEPDDASERAAEAALQAEGVHQQSSSTISSASPPGGFASTQR